MSQPVALVTGSARGIGAAIARLLRARGMQVIGHATRAVDAGIIAADCPLIHRGQPNGNRSPMKTFNLRAGYKLLAGASLHAGLAMVLLVSNPGCAHWPARPPVVVLETEAGTITVEVNTARAPVTGANFLKYVDGKFYDGGMINRAVRPDNTVRHDVGIQVIQFQSDPAREHELFPPIPMERTSVTGLKHLDGTLSMARMGPDTAQASFSIVIGDQPEMDFGGRRNPDGQGFAVFGRVVAGMDVVKKIHQSHTGTDGDYKTETLDPPIRVLRTYRR